LNEACATLQRRLRHELAWIWTDFLSKQRQATNFVETVGGQAATTACTMLVQDSRYVHNVSRQRSFCTVAYARMHERICIFCGECACIYTGVLGTMHVKVCMLDRGCARLLHARYRMCIYTYSCAVCSLIIGEMRIGGSTSP